MARDDNNSSEDDHSVPRGVGKRRRGWEGEDLEMNHQRESLREDKAKASAGVDISQFRNFEVGKGYQAKHVVRQRSSNQPAPIDIKDMSNTNKGTGEPEEAKPKLSVETLEDIRKSYIKSAGLREFRKEIEKILNS